MAADVPTPDAINAMIAEQFAGSDTTCAAVGTDFAIARYDVIATSLRPGGFVSGPTQFALADAALWYLVFGAIGTIEPMALTSELSMRFLRPAQGETMWARATLEQAGRRNVVGTVRIWCDEQTDRIVSTAQGTYALPL